MPAVKMFSGSGFLDADLDNWKQDLGMVWRAFLREMRFGARQGAQ
jgi:hypothetical protein